MLEKHLPQSGSGPNFLCKVQPTNLLLTVFCLLSSVYHLLLFQQLFPLRVNETLLGLVNAFIRVRAEEVALCLS